MKLVDTELPMMRKSEREKAETTAEGCLQEMLFF